MEFVGWPVIHTTERLSLSSWGYCWEGPCQSATIFAAQYRFFLPTTQCVAQQCLSLRQILEDTRSYSRTHPKAFSACLGSIKFSWGTIEWPCPHLLGILFARGRNIILNNLNGFKALRVCSDFLAWRYFRTTAFMALISTDSVIHRDTLQITYSRPTLFILLMKTYLPKYIP